MGPRQAVGLLADLLRAAALPALAETVLITPVLYAAPTGQYIRCQVLNTGAREISVVIEFVRPNGEVAASSVPLHLAPGESEWMTNGPAGSFSR